MSVNVMTMSEIESVSGGFDFVSTVSDYDLALSNPFDTGSVGGILGAIGGAIVGPYTVGGAIAGAQHYGMVGLIGGAAFGAGYGVGLALNDAFDW
ncbi:MAG: hypothetical protein V3V31_00010 [Methylococcales bacterium]